MRVRRAMVLAAGRGKRLRPLTDDRPKPLVAVAGRPLIDRVLDALAAAGVAECVVNVRYRAEMIAAHLAARRRPLVTLSPETEPLETGGGVARALAKLGSDPVFVVNADVLWDDAGTPALARLAEAWRDDLDALLLLVPRAAALGYDGPGDFDRDPAGRLTRRRDGATAAFVFAGVQILHPRLFAGAPEGAFSLNLLYDRAIAAGRARGLGHRGRWFHVGTPAAHAEAERRLAARRAG